MKKLGFGCMRLPLLEENNPKSVDIKQATKMVDTFIEHGFTYFDTAYMYHDFESENIMRKILVERHARDTFTLTSKLPTMFLKSEEDQERIFNEQLKKCGVDFFDYYLLHSLSAHHYEIAKRCNSFEFVQRKKSEGKIKHVGFSFHDTADLLDEILTAHPEVEFVQLQINYLDWDNISIQSKKCYEVAVKHHKPVIVMEPVKGGTLANIPEQAEKMMKSYRPDASIPSWAIRFAASLDNVKMVLSGMSSIEQLQDNISYMQDFTPINEKEREIINKVTEILHASIRVPCTACRYCIDGCPKKIPISNYFALYNAEKQALNKDFSTHIGYYQSLASANGKASDCIACRKCESICPQHIKIVDELKKVAKTFEV